MSIKPGSYGSRLEGREEDVAARAAGVKQQPRDEGEAPTTCNESALLPKEPSKKFLGRSCHRQIWPTSFPFPFAVEDVGIITFLLKHSAEAAKGRFGRPLLSGQQCPTSPFKTILGRSCQGQIWPTDVAVRGTDTTRLSSLTSDGPSGTTMTRLVRSNATYYVEEAPYFRAVSAAVNDVWDRSGDVTQKKMNLPNHLNTYQTSLFFINPIQDVPANVNELGNPKVSFSPARARDSEAVASKHPFDISLRREQRRSP